ncbi:hypothetical protein PsYK624_170210 [Phanerochaete sordida]|uniref:DUF6589 domain-containing protein n=1 Tax=Phanerochaete sordida TaxID=48140 RepID=A0A9P3LPJ9_9APHY|nr:hypothetical protein PsYK624_170210 [Phanerochaete sordida]
MAVNKRLRKRLGDAYDPIPNRTAAEAATEAITPTQQSSDEESMLQHEREPEEPVGNDELHASDLGAARSEGLFPAADEDNQSARREDIAEDDVDEAGADPGIALNMRRDPWLAVTTIMCMLLYIQYKFNTLFATIVGMLLFISRANHTIFAMCSRIGLSISRSDVLRKLHEIAKDSQKRLDDWIMQNPDGPFDGKVVFDNVNKMARAWDPTLGHRNILRCGTSAIVIKLEDVPEGALRLSPLLENIASNARSKLTVEELKKDINWAHVRGIGTGHILRTLVKHVPALQRHNSNVEHLFSESYAVHRLRLRKSDITSLRCSGANEATTAGVNEALQDVYDAQLKLSDERLEDSILIVGGDQLSVDRTRKLQRAVLKGGTNAECGRFLRPQLELWHTKWNNGKNIVQLNWAPTIEAGTFGLRHDCELLQRQLNPTKCDFYPMHGLLEVRFEALTLEGIRLLCEEYTGVVYPASDNLLDCLEKYFGKDGPLADHCFDCLEDMARTLYNRYYTETACDHSEHDDKWTEARYGPSAAFAPSARLASTADRVIANNVNFLRAVLWYLEFCTAVAVGDMGRVWEIIKIWRFSFWGCGATNYGNEMLELACNFLYEFSEKLRITFLNNWLVNPSGLPGHWQECDLLLEHYNYWIKLLFNAKSLDFDSKFLRECVSFNLRGFNDLRDRFRDIFRTTKSGGRHTPASIAADINKLGEHYRRDMVLVFHRGRTQSYTVVNEFSRGFNKLDGGQLDTFLQRTSREPFRVTPEELEDLEAEEERIPANPITVVNGVSSLQEFSTAILNEQTAP